MIESIKGSLNKYVDFSGRATRKEYWTFYLFYIVAMFISGFVGALLGTDALANIVLLILVIPVISCGARRMHDVGKSGWFQLVPFYNLFLSVQPSSPNYKS